MRNNFNIDAQLAQELVSASSKRAAFKKVAEDTGFSYSQVSNYYYRHRADIDALTTTNVAIEEVNSEENGKILATFEPDTITPEKQDDSENLATSYLLGAIAFVAALIVIIIYAIVK